MPRLVEIIKKQREEACDSDSDSDYGEIIAEGDDVMLTNFDESSKNGLMFDKFDESQRLLHADETELGESVPVSAQSQPSSTTASALSTVKPDKTEPSLYFIPHYCIKLDESIGVMQFQDSSYIHGSYMGTSITAKKVYS